jgi:hypothetical protein
VLVAALGTAAPYRDFLAKRWTYSSEYEFIVESLKSISDDCVIAGPGSDRKLRGLKVDQFMSREAGKDHRWVPAAEIPVGPTAPCAVYYRAASYFTYEPFLSTKKADWAGAERPACREMRERYRLEPIATTTIPAVPYEDEAFTVNPLPVGFYRVRAKTSR